MNRSTFPESFTQHDLGEGLDFYVGTLPTDLRWDHTLFAAVWRLHPSEHPRIHLHGREVAVPRWQQAYGMDYRFSGQTSHAVPVPDVLQPILIWARTSIFPQLNGLLLNWYEGPGHYIGPHHDSPRNMIVDAPIVTISFGETRTFRLSRKVGEERTVVNFPAPDGTVFVLPYRTNLAWKHSVPKSTKYRDQRISVTIRAFSNDTSETGRD